MELHTFAIAFTALSFVLMVHGRAAPEPTGAEAHPPTDADWRLAGDLEKAIELQPKRVAALFEALDLDRPGLEAVKSNWDAGDTLKAAEALLAYYRTTETAGWLREAPGVDPPREPNERERDLLENTFTFYGQRSTVPRGEDGSLDWDHAGPLDDKQWNSALHRHHQLRIAQRAYEQTGDPAFAKWTDATLRDWLTSANPLPPGRAHWKDQWWNGLNVSFRVKRWAEVFFAMQDEPLLQPGTRLLMLASLVEHGRYLRHHHAQGNWITMELSALGLLGLAWPEYDRAGSWVDYAQTTLTDELDAQLYPSGVQHELTAGYHWVALKNFEQFADTCRAADEPLPRVFAQRLERMWDYLARSMKPDGTHPGNNDSGHKPVAGALLRAAERYDRPDWAYIASFGEQGEKPEGLASVFYPHAGQLISRDGRGQDAQWSFFDVGPWGSGHQHNDKLHLSVFAGGRPLLVDAGRSPYQGKLAYLRHTYQSHSRSHNTILVDGYSQQPTAKVAAHPHQEYRIADEFDFAVGRFDDGYGPDPREELPLPLLGQETAERYPADVRHSRAVLYLRGEGWLVVDHVQAADPRARHAVQPLWHFHPDCTVRGDGRDVMSVDEDKGNVRIQPLGDVDWSVELVRGQEKPHPQGWYFERYNQIEPATCAAYEATMSGQATFGWFISTHEGQPDAPRWEVDFKRIAPGVARVALHNRQTDQRHRAIVNLSDTWPGKLDGVAGFEAGDRLAARLWLKSDPGDEAVALGELVGADGPRLAHTPDDAERLFRERMQRLTPHVEHFNDDGVPERVTVRLPEPFEVAADLVGGEGWRIEAADTDAGSAFERTFAVGVDPGKGRLYPWPRMTLQVAGEAFAKPLPIRADAFVKVHRPTLRLKPTAQAPKIDGTLNDAPWQGQPHTPHGFARLNPYDPVHVNTDAWLAWDEEELYLAVRCDEPRMPTLKIDATERDDSVYMDDSIELMLDVQRGEETYTQIIVNPAGVVYDGRGTDSKIDTEGLRVATRRAEDHWSVELALPWSHFGGRPGPDQAIGWLIGRNRPAKPDGDAIEVYQYPATLRSNHAPQWFADLDLQPR